MVLGYVVMFGAGFILHDKILGVYQNILDKIKNFIDKVR